MYQMDGVSDLCSRLRNGYLAKHLLVRGAVSRLNQGFLKVLSREGYIRGYRISQESPYTFDIFLKYVGEQGAISTIKRISMLKRRVYWNVNQIRRHDDGLGIYIISTPQGICSSKYAVQNNLGGEVLCQVY